MAVGEEGREWKEAESIVIIITIYLCVDMMTHFICFPIIYFLFGKTQSFVFPSILKPSEIVCWSVFYCLTA